MKKISYYIGLTLFLITFYSYAQVSNETTQVEPPPISPPSPTSASLVSTNNTENPTNHVEIVKAEDPYHIDKIITKSGSILENITIKIVKQDSLAVKFTRGDKIRAMADFGGGKIMGNYNVSPYTSDQLFQESEGKGFFETTLLMSDLPEDLQKRFGYEPKEPLKVEDPKKTKSTPEDKTKKPTPKKPTPPENIAKKPPTPKPPSPPIKPPTPPRRLKSQSKTLPDGSPDAPF